MTLDHLSRSERRRLRDLVVAATAAAGRTDPGPDLAALVDRAPQHAIPEAAALHRVEGSVLRGLSHVLLDSAVRDELTDFRDESALDHLFAVGALSSIVPVLDDAGVRWAVMKGPVLAGALYPHPGDRRYGDLDLLVHPADYAAAMELLEGLGYEHTIHDWARAEHVLAGQVNLASTEIEIDLHWHLHYSREDRRPFAIDPTDMLTRVQRRTLSGLDTPVLDPVDHLIVLTFHAARSGGHRLLWLKDIERALVVDQPDHDEIRRRCAVARCEPMVGLLLERTRAVLDAPVDVDLIASLLPSSLRRAERAVTSVWHPIALHEQDTVPQALSRSVRASFSDTVLDLPGRAIRSVGDHRHTLDNETDNPAEKASYLRAVARQAPS